MKRKFTSDKGLIAEGALAQACICDDLVFLSGQISINPETKEIERGSMKEQTRRVLNNLKGILEDMELTMDHVAKTNVYISDMSKFDDMNEVYQEFFNDENPPARQTVEVGIWDNLDVEISAVATMKSID
jgi:2-iminobutanoate/2-iminopropanoate deaminase